MTTLSDVAVVNPRDRVTQTFPVSVIGVADLDVTTRTAHPRLAPDEADVRSAARVARPGDVLFARISPSMENGKVAIVPPLRTEYARVSTELFVVRPRHDIDPKILWALLRWDGLRESLVPRMTGSAGQQRLHPRVIEALSVPDDRGRLQWAVDVLDHLDAAAFARRAAIAELEGLAAAAVWKVAGSAPRTTLASYGVDVGYGTSDRSSAAGEVPVLRIPNVVDGRITALELRYLARGSSTERFLLQNGDLLVVRTNGNPERLGRAAVYEGEPKGAVAASYLLRVRCGPRVDPDFLWAWFRTEEARAALRGSARTSAGQYNINATFLKTRLPVPELDVTAQVATGQIMRAIRRGLETAWIQSDLLEHVVQRHLASVFGGVTPFDTSPFLRRSVVAEIATAIPERLVVLSSPEQLAVWNKALRQDEPFVVESIAATSTTAYRAQQALEVLEQLGLLLRETSAGIEQWRMPDESDFESKHRSG